MSVLIQVTNQQLAHALPGASVLITLNSAEAISKLPLLAVDMKCTLGSSANIGYISSVDKKGTTFRVQPQQRSKTVDGITANNVLAGEIITVTLS